MTPILQMMLTALVAVGQDLPPAEAPAASPASAAQVERFLAVLPGHDRLERTDFAADPEELARLGALNPGRVEQIRPVLEAYADCAGPIGTRLNAHMLRTVAAALGEEKLGRMIAFYEHEDHQALGPIMDKAGRGEAVSAAEQAELDRISASYPLADFGREMMSFNPAFWDETLMNAMTACEQARDADFARIGVRQSGEESAPGFEIGGGGAE